MHQTRSVAEYIHKFEDLSTQISGISDTQREGIFMNSLTPEMQEVVTMCKPVDLPEMIATAYQKESSSLLNVVKKEMQQRNKMNHTNHQDTSSYSSYQANSGWKQKQVTQPAQPTSEQKKNNTNARPTLRLSDTQLAEKKRLGLYFQCDAKWSRQHASVCPYAALRVLTVVNGVEMEVVTQELDETDEDDIVWDPQMRVISVSSLLGLYSPTTTKLKGTIKKQVMVVMLDSGAKHNFISPTMAKQLKLKTDQRSLEIMLGT